MYLVRSVLTQWAGCLYKAYNDCGYWYQQETQWV